MSNRGYNIPKRRGVVNRQPTGRQRVKFTRWYRERAAFERHQEGGSAATVLVTVIHTLRDTKREEIDFWSHSNVKARNRLACQ